MTEPLITKYRPQAFEEVVGNEIAIKSLVDALNSPTRPKSYLFSGPTGLGKTTLARIVAEFVNATATEIDVASNAGVDNVRELVDLSNFTPIIAGGSRMYILDECHVFSKTAWQALLKMLEEPPSHLYIALCTTEPGKVPDSIKGRCFHTQLKPIKTTEMDDLLMTICELEEWPVPDDVFGGIVQAAEGLPRKGLSLLQQGHGVANKAELATIIEQVEREDSPVMDFCKYILSGGKNWERIREMMAGMADDDAAFETIGRYMYTVMSKSDEVQAQKAFRILEAVTFPRNTVDRKALLATVIGALLWA